MVLDYDIVENEIVNKFFFFFLVEGEVIIENVDEGDDDGNNIFCCFIIKIKFFNKLDWLLKF